MNDRDEVNELAEELNEFTIASLNFEERNADWSASEKPQHILNFPNEILVHIFSRVADPKFNPNPPEDFRIYINARDRNDYKIKQHGQNPSKVEWWEKKEREYAVRNLLSLRRVCSDFENVINNAMVPGVDYQPIEVDIKFMGTKHSKSVQLFKYGGTGAIYPCTRLKRISKFNEYDDYEHLEKFEKIRKLTFVDIPINKELFETILRMDLKTAKKVEFYSNDTRFEKDIEIVKAMKDCLSKVDTNAEFWFNSAVFNKDSLLSGVRPPPVVIVDDRKFHKEMRRGRNQRVDVGDYRGYRAINIIHNILHSSPHEHPNNKDFPYNTREGRLHWQKMLMAELKERVKWRSAAMKDFAEWHLGKLFVLLARQPINRRQLFDHLKILRKISSGKLISASEEKSMIANATEMRHRNDMVSKFEFVHKFHGRHRLYTIHVTTPSEEPQSQKA